MSGSLLTTSNPKKYTQQTERSRQIATGLLKKASQAHPRAASLHSELPDDLNRSHDLNQARVAFLTKPNLTFVEILWGIWRAGGITVPLCTSHPEVELEYSIKNSQAKILIADDTYFERLSPIAKKNDLLLFNIGEFPAHIDDLPEIDGHRLANILFTSGTTSKPKGVVTTHAQLLSQVQTLVEAWHWSEDDFILNVLPLHHTHGLINVLCCALYVDAEIEFIESFDSQTVWQKFKQKPINLFMAVPTVYSKLIKYFDLLPPAEQKELTQVCKRFRLMISGSAALSEPIFKRWQEISGQTLLERYGMTETGMSISNPYVGERKAGHVGQPLPRVEVKLVDQDKNLVAPGTSGEIFIKGPNVFKEYWQNQKATQKAFHQGWFQTGDTAVLSENSYKILGRNSVDIIKSGGYKISALEIESVLKSHPQIEEVAVVGIEDEEWGQRVAACIVCQDPSSPLSLKQLQNWAKPLLAAYKIPSRLICRETLPRNSMGKLTKIKITQFFK